jgi:hypothetical protein
VKGVGGLGQVAQQAAQVGQLILIEGQVAQASRQLTALQVRVAESIVIQLKGPKREMFVAGIFTEIRPVWVETMPKNLKSLCLGPYINFLFPGIFVLALQATAQKKNWELGRKKVDLDCFYIHLFGLKRFF